MRIAQIAPLTEAVPPKLYGGTERVVSFLTEELVAMGHDVTLFASGDSETTAQLEPMWPRALRFDPTLRDSYAPVMLMLEQVARRADEFDVLHCHLDYWTFSLFSRIHTPFITTLHGRLDLPELAPMYDCFSDVPLVSISDAQRKPLPQANFISTVHHGLPLGLLTPQDDRAGLPGVPGPHLPREAAGSRHQDRPRRRHEAEDRRQGRSGGRSLLRERNPPDDRRHPRSR